MDDFVYFDPWQRISKVLDGFELFIFCSDLSIGL